MVIRPIGVMNTMNANRIHHHETVGAQLTSTNQPRTLFAIASHVTHCSPVSVVSGTVTAICAS